MGSLIALLLILQIIFVRMTNYDQALLLERQQFINQGEQSEVHLRQLAARIYQVSQQTQDQGLKDLLVRQQITITPNTDGSTNADSTPAAH